MFATHLRAVKAVLDLGDDQHVPEDFNNLVSALEADLKKTKGVTEFYWEHIIVACRLYLIMKEMMGKDCTCGEKKETKAPKAKKPSPKKKTAAAVVTTTA